MSRIFISHSSVNNAEAIAVHDWLATNGWDDVFLDLDAERGLKPGERWQEALKAAAHRCEVVLFLISPAWATSRWCLAEFLLAKTLNKRLLGVFVEATPLDKLPVEMTAEWQLLDLTDKPRDVALKVKLPRVRRSATVCFNADGLTRLRIGLDAAGLDARYFAWPPPDDPQRPPYRGLKPLEAEDAGIFFGRDGVIVEAMDRLRGLRDAASPRLLVILGASGSGKSSFLRAGLLPRLARDDRHFLPLPILRPERAAVGGETGLVMCLVEALAMHGVVRSRAAIRKAVEEGSAAVRPLLLELARNAAATVTSAPKPPMLVLAIDQGEELYLAEGADEAEEFMLLLRDLVSSDDPELMAVFTVRSDAYERLQLDDRLEGVCQHTLSLPPMPRGAFAEIITGPAQRLRGTGRSLAIEGRLTDALLTDIEEGGAKDALPLLAFTLERLYAEHGGDGDLTVAEYDDLGRIRGSIEAAVERALKAADADSRVPKDRHVRLALLRRGLIPWLAGIDLDTGAPRRRVARLSEIPEEARPLIEHLVEQRLLSTDTSMERGDVTIEPTHEALLRQWGLLEGWLAEDSEALKTLEGVKRAARDWHLNKKNATWVVHTGGRLEAADHICARDDLAAQLEPGDMAYLAAARVVESAQLARARRTRHVMLFGLGAVATIVILTGLSVVAVWSWMLAKEEQAIAMEQRQIADVQRALTEAQRNDAMIAESLFLSDFSLAETGNGNAIEGVLLALAGLKDQNASALSQRERPLVESAESSLASGLRGRQESFVLHGHGGKVWSVAFSPDGARLVTASDDMTARLWDARTRVEIVKLQGHVGGVLSAAFSPDGMRIVTASMDGTARVWDSVTGAQIVVLRGHDDAVLSAAFSPSGARVVTGSSDTTARIWDIKAGAVVTELRGHESAVSSVAFSPDGARIVTASRDQAVRVWEADGGKSLRVLRGHEGRVWSAAFSPSGANIVTASSDRTARIWDAKTGAEIAILRGHEGDVFCAVFSQTGSQIVTASSDTTVRVWDAKKGEIAGILRGHEDQVSNAAFAPDGTHIVTASADGTIRLWDADPATAITVLHGPDARVNSAAFSPNALQVVTASDDRTARLWDAKTRMELTVMRGHEDRVWRAAFSPDGEGIVTASSDRTARLWNVATGAETAVLRGHDDEVFSAVFSPDGARILTASWDNTARLWDAGSGRVLAVLSGHRDRVWSAAFSPAGERIVTASGDRTARVWDSETGVEIAILRGHEDNVLSAMFSPDGLNIVTASDDGTARLWDVATGTQNAVLRGHDDRVWSAAFSPDGTRIVTASGDKTVRMWDAHTGEKLDVLRAHEYEVLSASFSADGLHIVTASWDKTAALWEVLTTPQSYVDLAKMVVPRCLSLAQRQRFHLAPEPPDWCIEMRKWPYDTDAWRNWLAETRAGGSPVMPE